MALTVCPECGREGVSDTAESCPGCGYNIKAHYERIERQKRDAAKREKEADEAIKRLELMDEMERRRELNSVEPPSSNMKYIIFVGCLAAIFILGGIAAIASPRDKSDIVLGIIGIPFGIFFAIGTFMVIKEYKEDTELYNNDRDAYIKREVEAYRRRKNERAAKSYGSSYSSSCTPKPKCPVCGSFNTERISHIERAVSVDLLGLASDTIGKQYRCNNCKHMW